MFAFDALSGEVSSFSFSATTEGKLFFHPAEGVEPTTRFKPSPLFIALGSMADDAEINAFAQAHGPLFGTACWMGEEGAIVENAADWRAASKVLGCALKLKAYADGKARIEDVSEFFHAIVLPGKKGFVVIAGCTFPEAEGSAYWKRLNCKGGEQSYYNEDGSKVSLDVKMGETLSANIVFTSSDYEPLPQAVRDSERIFADATDFEDFPKSEMAECIKSSLILLIQAHTEPVRMGFVGEVYQPLVDSLLTGIWHEFGQSFSGETIGICKECGKIIDCTNERNGMKEYCSKRCRDKARNRRNWLKTKLKRFIDDGCSLEEAAEKCGTEVDNAKVLLDA